MNKKPVNSNPTKEFFTLLKTIESVTKNQARIPSYNPDDISTFIVEITPRKGVYQHGKFLFQIQLMLYPREFPNVICISDIYHPNIEHGEDYHNVCLNLFDNWNRSFGLIDVIQGLIFLLYQPNIHDPISSLFNSRNTNDETFRKNVHTSLHGGIVDGVKFLPNPGIIEYIESQKKSNSTEPGIIDAETTVDPSVEAVIQPTYDGDVDVGNDVTVLDSEDDEELTSTMRNNNAPQECLDDCLEECDAVIGGEINVDLPTRDIVSPNALYSDLICSRYAQPDKLSESEYGSNDVYHASIAFDLFGFRTSTYASAESDLGAFDSYDDPDEWYGVDDGVYPFNEGETFDNEDNDSNDGIGSQCGPGYDNFISESANSLDPSNLFLTKWLEIRRENNQSRIQPAPMTAIILTKVFNPFRPNLGIFFLYDDSNNWRQSHTSVRRIDTDDRPLHLMICLTNLCRWSMNRQLSSSFSDMGSEQLLCYSLFVTLSSIIHTRLGNVYNYGSEMFNCIFVR